MGFPVSSLDGNVTTLDHVVRETMTDQVELPKVVMAWQSPGHFARGDAELDLVAGVLATGKASRLYESLVYRQRLAQSVTAEQASGTIGSRFVVEAIAQPGVSLERLEAAIDRELALVRGPADPHEADAARVRPRGITVLELTRARNGIQAAFVRRLQSVRERAAALNEYEAELGDPGHAQKDFDRYTGATLEGVREAARKVLDPNARVILRIVPGEKAAPP
jgi:predicted Zn-dependent peptidase